MANPNNNPSYYTDQDVLNRAFNATTGTLLTSAGAGSTVAALSVPAVSTTSAVLKAANAARKGLIFYNDTDQTVYVAFAATATTTAYTLKVPANTMYDPSPLNHTGAISGITAAATTGAGLFHVTELT